MLVMTKRSRIERGDTIVEVLIAIAIVSLVLVTAYTISNKNVEAVQANQERIQAQHLVEGQIESLKAQTGITAPNTCFDVLGSAASGTSCTQTAAGSGASYTISTTAPGVAPPTQCASTISSVAYIICTYWTSLGGSSNNDSNVTMYYRLN
jgi:prepilin-type N-terminal cleavage/methylation domain-containing protein